MPPQGAEAEKKLSELLGAGAKDKWVAIAPDYSNVLGESANLSDLQTSVRGTDAVFHFVSGTNAAKTQRMVELELSSPEMQHRKFLVLVDPSARQITMPPAIAQLFGVEVFEID